MKDSHEKREKTIDPIWGKIKYQRQLQNTYGFKQKE